MPDVVGFRAKMGVIICGRLAWEASDCHQHGYAVTRLSDKWISRQTVWIRVTIERALRRFSMLEFLHSLN